MATKEHRRLAKGLIETLESRVHSGPPIHERELHSVREFLQVNDFSPASDYFSRLGQIQHRLVSRPSLNGRHGKRNYGGEAGGYWMQVQSAYDHVIVSTCYSGEFNTQRGRIKISHRFNSGGRLDFVEVKLLKSLHPALNGELRKLICLKNYQSLAREWHQAEGFVLGVLPRELVFLYREIYRMNRGEMFSWLLNIGHRLAGDLVEALRQNTVSPIENQSEGSQQLPLALVREDEVALPILEKAGQLEASAEVIGDTSVVVSYCRKLSPVSIA